MDYPEEYKAAVNQQLDQMLSHPIFRGAKRSCSFLRYVSEKTLNGKSYQIKEFSIAIDAFGLETTFDQQLDPRIRVEAKRLRDRLKKYYEGPGVDDPMVITMEKGSYVPLFHYRETKVCLDKEDKTDSGDVTILISEKVQIHLAFSFDCLESQFLERLNYYRSVLINSLFSVGQKQTAGFTLEQLAEAGNNALGIVVHNDAYSLKGMVHKDLRLNLASSGTMIFNCQDTLSIENFGDEETIEQYAAADVKRICDLSGRV